MHVLPLNVQASMCGLQMLNHYDSTATTVNIFALINSLESTRENEIWYTCQYNFVLLAGQVWNLSWKYLGKKSYIIIQ